jgi:class 3 adenylate cyclase
MEPRIQYAKTEDGVSIAYCVAGESTPLLHLGFFPVSHIQAEWQITPECRLWYERLAKKRRLVRFDCRGTGLSERDVTDFSVDARILDLDAIVDHLQLEGFALFASMHYAPVAIAYAARNPTRVSHLVLWHGFARATDFTLSPQVQGTRAVLDKDWQTFTETAAHALVVGWGDGELARRVATLFRESITHEAMQAFVPVGDRVDVTDLLPQVRVPTLVIHRREFAAFPVEVARGLASRIPDARMSLLEGAGMLPFVGDMQSALDVIDEFLDDRPASEPQAAAVPYAGGLATILFTDVEGSTALTDRLGDAKARELLREHESTTRDALKAHGGSEVKTMGDGFMASFGSATKALECAIAIQQSFAEHNESAEESIRVRIGLNAGEPIAENDPDGRGDLFGTAVNMAARIAAKTGAGEILVADVVRQLVAGKEFLFADRGETELRGFEDPVRLFEVRWSEEE